MLLTIVAFSQDNSYKLDSLLKWSKALRQINPDSSIALSEIGISLSKQNNDQKKLATFLHYIAVSLEQKMQTGDALKKYIEAQEIFEKIGDIQGESNCIQGLANIYRASSNYEAAEINYKKVIELRTQIKDTIGLFNTTLSLGMTYFETNQLDQARKYFNQSMDIAISTKNNKLIGSAESELGNIYYREGQFKKSLQNQFSALSRFRSTNDLYDEAICLSYIAKAYSSLGMQDTALYYANISLILCQKTGDLENIANVYKIQSKAYELNKQFDSAYITQNKFLQLQEQSLKNNRSVIDKLNINIATREKQNEIEILNKNKEKDDIVRNAIILISLLILVALVVFVRSSRIRKKANKELTEKNSEIEKQKEDLKHKNDEINASIKYAERIQKTLLAHDTFLKENIPCHFVLYKPKDVVSGDFYWASKGRQEVTRNAVGGMVGGTETISVSITEMDDLFFFAVCDSTGHGIPGAFMSLLNISFLNQAVIEKGLINPNEILNYVRKMLIENISKDGAKDGMDAILICRNQTTGKLCYAAANNKPVLISSSGIVELPTDKMPVGLGERTDEFNIYEIEFKKGDFLYLSTDGFADQFGGPKGKKYKSKRLNELLMEVSKYSIEEQKQLLEKEFENWKDDLEQVDDVCIFGLSL